MKNYTVLLILLLSFILTGCPGSDEGEIIENFEPVTIDLSGLNIQEDDTSFSKNGYSFTSFHAESVESISSTFQGNSITFDGIALWFSDGQNPSYIELILDNTEGISKITARIYNNGTGTPVVLYNDGNIIDEIDAPFKVNDIVFDVTNKTIDRLRISSFEGAVLSIKLE